MEKIVESSIDGESGREEATYIWKDRSILTQKFESDYTHTARANRIEDDD